MDGEVEHQDINIICTTGDLSSLFSFYGQQLCASVFRYCDKMSGHNNLKELMVSVHGQPAPLLLDLW